MGQAFVEGAVADARMAVQFKQPHIHESATMEFERIP